MRRVDHRVIARLTQAGVADPLRDYHKLWAWAQNQGRRQAIDIDAETTAQKLFESAIEARVARKPVSQIIGSRAFWKHEFLVNDAVLDPRPETESLVEQALLHRFDRVLDLGTGSGAVLLSLLAERPKSTGVGCDISPAALTVAVENARALGVNERATFQESNWFSRIEGCFNLIVSNPPYIAQDEIAQLAPELRLHEPLIALTDGKDGLSAYQEICAHAQDYLTPGGWLLVEIGATQGSAVFEIFSNSGFSNIKIGFDLDRRDRVVSGQKTV